MELKAQHRARARHNSVNHARIKRIIDPVDGHEDRYTAQRRDCLALCLGRHTKLKTLHIGDRPDRFVTRHQDLVLIGPQSQYFYPFVLRRKGRERIPQFVRRESRVFGNAG
jgi:hypothetical protein